MRRYSAPLQNRHSLQVEINRKLYMSEETLQIHAGFESLQTHLKSLVLPLLQTDPRALDG